jgi:hypothetical protein
VAFAVQGPESHTSSLVVSSESFGGQSVAPVVAQSCRVCVIKKMRVCVSVCVCVCVCVCLLGLRGYVYKKNIET